ncbi:MAG: response regulator, partial [Planctomycetales bacterium]|nr:response regulator [Planctomycetales bacterium]
MSHVSELHRLLLLEADELLGELISFRLEMLGYSVSIARTLAEATLASAERFDLVLIDADIESVDAADFVMELRADSVSAETPVLILSSISDPEQIRKLHVAGANAYVVMPYDPATLEDKIEQLLAGGRTRVTV